MSRLGMVLQQAGFQSKRIWKARTRGWLVRGTTALQLEDLLMLLYASLAGMAVWFPMLFRTKFRFTSQQLLITSAFRGCAYAILAVSLMWSLHESVHDLQHFFMALFIFNVIHMYLAGASGYGLYTTLFKHFMADNMSRYGEYITLSTIDSQLLSILRTFRSCPRAKNSQLSTLSQSVMGVTLKQIFGQIIWVSGFMTFAFLLLDIPRVRTGIEKVPYWPVYGIKMLARLR